MGSVPKLKEGGVVLVKNWIGLGASKLKHGVNATQALLETSLGSDKKSLGEPPKNLKSRKDEWMTRKSYSHATVAILAINSWLVENEKSLIRNQSWFSTVYW